MDSLFLFIFLSVFSIGLLLFLLSDKKLKINWPSDKKEYFNNKKLVSFFIIFALLISYRTTGNIFTLILFPALILFLTGAAIYLKEGKGCHTKNMKIGLVLDLIAGLFFLAGQLLLAFVPLFVLIKNLLPILSSGTALVFLLAGTIYTIKGIFFDRRIKQPEGGVSDAEASEKEGKSIPKLITELVGLIFGFCLAVFSFVLLLIANIGVRYEPFAIFSDIVILAIFLPIFSIGSAIALNESLKIVNKQDVKAKKIARALYKFILGTIFIILSLPDLIFKMLDQSDSLGIMLPFDIVFIIGVYYIYLSIKGFFSLFFIFRDRSEKRPAGLIDWWNKPWVQVMGTAILVEIYLLALVNGKNRFVTILLLFAPLVLWSCASSLYKLKREKKFLWIMTVMILTIGLLLSIILLNALVLILGYYYKKIFG